MTNFEKLTASPEALAAFLSAIPVADSPWDDAFHKQFCHGCGLENCDHCPHEAERNNPAWWLVQTAEETTPQQENLNWIVLSMPEDCHSIFVCVNKELFDERIRNGLKPLHDDRDRASGTSVPCFIGYAATEGPTDLDTLAGFPKAKQEEAPKADCRSL